MHHSVVVVLESCGNSDLQSPNVTMQSGPELHYFCGFGPRHRVAQRPTCSRGVPSPRFTLQTAAKYPPDSFLGEFVSCQVVDYTNPSENYAFICASFGRFLKSAAAIVSLGPIICFFFFMLALFPNIFGIPSGMQLQLSKMWKPSSLWHMCSCSFNLVLRKFSAGGYIAGIDGSRLNFRSEIGSAKFNMEKAHWLW